MTVLKFLNKLFVANNSGNGGVSIRTLGGDSPGKRQLYERALEGAALDQKKIVDAYNKKFEFQGKIFTK